jgi:hypothetical protein
MPPFLKRALLMLAGAILVLASLRGLATDIVDPSAQPLPPANNEERVIMILTDIVLIAIGGYMFVRGKRIRLPE